jgi:hypothetical protein
VLVSGEVDPPWPAAGRGLCTAAGEQYLPTIVPDGAGGAIASWMDFRGGLYSDIYAQRVYGGGGVVAVEPGGSPGFTLEAPRPNPARGDVTMSLGLAAPQRVTVEVFDSAGRRVRTLAVGRELGAGTHRFVWAGENDEGLMQTSGMYVVRVSAAGRTLGRRLALIR